MSTSNLATFISLPTPYASLIIHRLTPIQSLEFYKTLFAIKDQTPLPVVLVYGVGNVILNGLNVLWFFKMIAALQKRMKPNDQGPPTDKKDT